MISRSSKALGAWPGLRPVFHLLIATAIVSTVSTEAAADVVLKLGDILVAEPGTSSISVIDPATGARTVISQGGLLSPANKTIGVALALDGSVIAVHRLTGLIRIDPATGAQSVLSQGGLFRDPWAITVHKDTGDIYVADSGYDFDRPTINEAGKIIRVNPVSGLQELIAAGTPCNVFPANSACQNTTSAGSYLNHPYGIAFDYSGSGGTLVVADMSSFNGKGAIVRIQPVANGTQTLLWGPASAVPAPQVPQLSPVGCPMGVAVEPNGNVLTSVFTFPVPASPSVPPPPGTIYGCAPPGLYRMDLANHVQRVLNANAPPWLPNHSYVAGEVQRPDASPGYVHRVITPGTSQGSTPAWNTTVGGTTSDGTVTWQNIGPGASWLIPFGVAVEPAPSNPSAYNIIVGDEGHSMLFRLTAAGEFAPSGAPLATGLSNVTSVSVITVTPPGTPPTPPVRSNGQPTGTLPFGTTQTSLSLTTNENATCRYSATPGVAYGSMTNTFATTGGTAHATPVTGLTNGGTYNFYVRCVDGEGSANIDDFVIAFSVAATSNGATSNFAGTENPLSENGTWDTPGSWTPLQKNNGAFTTALNAQARLVTPQMSPDQFAEITYDQNPGAASWVGVTTRTQSATNGSGYLAIAFDGEVRLYRTDDVPGLSFTQLASATADLSVAPRRLRLESQGNTHKVYFNGDLKITHTAAAPVYSTGQPGLAASVFGGPQVKILSFAAGELGAAALPTLSINDVSVTEGNAGTTNAVFTVTLSESSASTVTVNFATQADTATANVDFATTSGPLTFAPGVTQQTVSIPVLGDQLDEANEQFFVNLSGAINATILDSQGSGVIVDDDPTPSVSIGDVSVPEGNSGTSTAAFTLTLSAPSGQTVTVAYATANGSATAGSDYVAAAGTATFAPGATTATVNVTINGDTTIENDETFVVNLSSPSNVTIGDAQATGTIVNDDGQRTLSIGNATVTEGHSGTINAVLTVTLSSASTETVTVSYTTANNTATAGNDYQAVTNTLTFTPGQTSKTISVSVIGDTLDEINETFLVNLSLPVNATILDGEGLATITDDDPVPTISINDVSVPEGNSGTSVATFTLSLSAASGKTVTVNYATANVTASSASDYVAATGTATFAIGATTATVNVTINGDTTIEGNETFRVNLTSPTNATIADSQGTGTIVNDEALPTLTIGDRVVTEGNTGTVNASFTVTLSPSSAQQVTVGFATANDTATAGSDYVAQSGTVTFTAGATSRTITIVVSGDTLDEPNETFFVNLSTPTNAAIADGQGLGTITDNDPPPTLSITDASLTEGNSGPATATFTISLSAVPWQQVSVLYATANGTALAGTDYVATSGTAVIPAGATSLTVNVPVTVNGDTLVELNENFVVNLSGATNATIADGQGVGVIVNDDGVTPPPSGLVAAYGFGEGSGPTTADSSGLGHTGSISGAAWTPLGHSGNALSFDGVNDWVTVADANDLDFTSAMTLEAWVHPTELGNGTWRNVLIKERSGGEVYNLYANADPNVPTVVNVPTVYVVRSAQPATPLNASGILQLPLNTWSHLAVTFDNATLRLYVNGVQVGSRAVAGPLLTSTGALRIGGNSVWGEFFAGRIDDVRIYNRALTAVEIMTDMLAAVP